jgi:hypothetical protein
MRGCRRGRANALPRPRGRRTGFREASDPHRGPAPGTLPVPHQRGLAVAAVPCFLRGAMTVPSLPGGSCDRQEDLVHHWRWAGHGPGVRQGCPGRRRRGSSRPAATARPSPRRSARPTTCWPSSSTSPAPTTPIRRCGPPSTASAASTCWSTTRALLCGLLRGAGAGADRAAAGDDPHRPDGRRPRRPARHAQAALGPPRLDLVGRGPGRL